MRGRKGAGWTAGEDETIRHMAEANASAVRIAARLRRTVSSVSRRAVAQGISIRTNRDMRTAVKRAGEEASQ